MNILSLVILIIEVPGILFHISVLVVLIRRILRKDEIFRHGFFILYIASSLGDCAYVINKEGLFGLPLMGFLPGFYRSCASVCATFIFTFSMTSATFQNMLHAVIAFNRITAFFWPQQHVRFWRRRNLTAILLVVCGFSLAVSVPNAFFPSEYVLDDDKAIRGLGSDGYVAKITSYVNLVTKVFFALCGFAFSLASALRLRTLIEIEQLANFSGNQDVRLFAHSMFMVFAQLLGVAYLVMVQIKDAFFNNNPSFLAFTQVYSSVVACFYCLSNPVFLLILSENVRRAYGVFYRIRPRDDSVIRVKATITPLNALPQSTA